MKILIAGASGFIGQKLVATLLPMHCITVLGRSMVTLNRYFKAPVHLVTWESLSREDATNFDVVINLCGHNIGASRWNTRVKQALIDSRVETTRQLLDWLITHKANPRVMCANAIGIYGMQESADLSTFDERSVIESEPPRDFLSEIGVRWQQALEPAMAHGMSVTSLRFGVVLGRGGMLKKLLPSFYIGCGSIIGDGQQMLSWVHRDDVIHAIEFLLKHPELTGAFNVTSPYPVTQAEFARTLAAQLHRPLWLKLPASLVRFLFGEMGECLLLKGQRVIPSRLIEAGYVFAYPQLKEALADILSH